MTSPRPIKPGPIRCALYTRISDARDGETAGVERQRRDCLKHAEAKGYLVVAHYSDNNRSAMTGRRPAFEEMVQALNGLDVIVVWSADRLYRQAKDLERLVEILDGTRVEALHSGEIDLGTADGRAMARVIGAFGQRESEKMSERVASAYEERARAGRWGGGSRRFGFNTDTSALVPHEADLIRQAYLSVDSGGSVNGVARAWNEAGVRGPNGGTFQSKTVRGILLRPRNAGLAVHRGQIVGEAQGPAIIDRETWARVRARLESNKGPGRTAAHLLSGIARCGKCGGPLWHSIRTGRNGGRSPCYKCKRCYGVDRSQFALEAKVLEPMLALLDARREDIAAAVRPASGASEESAASLRRELGSLASMLADGRISSMVYAAAATRLEERIAAAEAAPKGTPSAAVQGLLASGDVYAAFDRCPVGVQRQVVEMLVADLVVPPKGADPEIRWIELDAGEAARVISNGEELGPDDPDRTRVFPTFERALAAVSMEELYDPHWMDWVNKRP